MFYLGYVGISPEMVPKTNKILEELLAMNEGNMKDALQSIWGNGDVANGLYSLGNLKLANHYHDRMRTIRIDSEALDDQKAGALQMSIMYSWHLKMAIWDTATMRNNFTDLFSMSKRFPKATATLPFPFMGNYSKRCMSLVSVAEGDWENAESLYSESTMNGKEKYAIWPNYSHHNVGYMIAAMPCLALREYKLQKGEDISAYDDVLRTLRKSLESYAKLISGCHRCSGVAIVAKITLALKDRSFAETLKQLEDALAYTIELACFPLDILDLELEIALWKGDAKKCKELLNKCESIEYKFHSVFQKKALEQLESGEMKPVDLTYIPEVKDPILTDEEKLVKLKEDLKVAKAEVKATSQNGTDEEVLAARTYAKAVKTQLKQLQKEIAEKARPTIDQAKIDEVKAKILEALARQERAFDDDDDDAEEAAAAEVNILRAQLKELETGGGVESIPKQKLEDAKKKDAEINK